MNPSLTVVGLVYFELSVPAAAVHMGRETFVDAIGASAGGALNTAWTAHVLGMSVVLMHPAGSGLADRAVSMAIARLGITSLTWDARDDTAISLVLTGADDRAFISSADFAALERCPELGRSDWIHVPGLREARILEPRLAEAKARGAKISVAGSWAVEELDLLARARRPWDLLLLNEEEAQRAAGSIDDACDRLASACPNVVVTLGARGALGSVGGERFSVPALSTETNNPTGAGDAFAAGFLFAHARGAAPARAAELGAAVASRWLGARDRFDPTSYTDLRAGP